MFLAPKCSTYRQFLAPKSCNYRRSGSKMLQILSKWQLRGLTCCDSEGIDAALRGKKIPGTCKKKSLAKTGPYKQPRNPQKAIYCLFGVPDFDSSQVLHWMKVDERKHRSRQGNVDLSHNTTPSEKRNEGRKHNFILNQIRFLNVGVPDALRIPV